MTSVHYPDDPTSVGQARAFVASTLPWASEDLRDRAVLITSELATNAILHGRTAFTVTATVTAEELHVAVTDSGGSAPLLRRPGSTEPHGRGLLIASSLADRWGVETEAGHTTVWFALALDPVVS